MIEDNPRKVSPRGMLILGASPIGLGPVNPGVCDERGEAVHQNCD